MNLQGFFTAIANPFVGALLRSPLHGFIGANTMLVTVRGRKSGRAITTPVNYLRQGDDLLVISQAGRTWWRNLRGAHLRSGAGVPVTCVLQGREVSGRASVIEDETGVAEGLAAFAKASPAYARFLGVAAAADGATPEALLLQAAAGRVLVRVRLDQAGHG